MKQTKIVATVGPVSESYETLEALALAGVNVFRLNFSHGTHKWHGEVIKRIRRLNKKLGTSLAILLDTKGPEIRTGDLRHPIEVKAGDELILSIDAGDYDETGKLGVSYDEFVDDVEKGERILVDNGVINLIVKRKRKGDVICEVLDDGEITSRRHLNLPGKEISLEAITKKDWEDIKFGVDMGVDFIALSFVRQAADVQELKKFLDKKKSKIGVIAKIESFEATKHLGSITEASDGIMVARGDLGAEIPFTEVPRIQHELIELASEYRKPVIVATHMLESMIENPMPTRAEVTDVSHATWQRTDCVMLSGETAGGEYPLKSVETMVEIVKQTEADFAKKKGLRDLEITSEREEFAKLAARMPEDLDDIEAIMVVTRSGEAAGLVSAFRPKVPIFAFTNETPVRRKMQMIWGISAFRIDFSSTPNTTIERARDQFLRSYPDWKGKKYVLVSDALVEKQFIPTLQIRTF